ncbi:hypothetical protein ACFT5C_06485 [Streptomyces sp. NPDC057116]|uniref:hypothetical protein n=1 Tax=Streptomyces sp. NPDC057116 TaxID=3346023 RepID=UPI0036397CBE
MRLLTPRRVAVTALCAAFALGTAGPALAHSPHQAAKEQVKEHVRAPQDIGDILGSIGGVLDAVLGTVSGSNSSTQTLPATSDMNQQMKDLTAAIEALRKAAAEANATPSSAPVTSTPAPATGTSTGMPADDRAPMDPMDTTDADMDQAFAAMDKAIDDLVDAAAKGQATASATQVQAATKKLVDTIMRDINRMSGTPTTGMTTLPATSQQVPVTGL